MIKEHDDCVSRADARHLIAESFRKNLLGITFNKMFETLYKGINELPPVTPTHGTCKNCEHWKDSDGVYRRGVDAESKCPINIKEVCEGNFYCKNFEKRGSENGSN